MGDHRDLAPHLAWALSRQDCCRKISRAVEDGTAPPRPGLPPPAYAGASSERARATAAWRERVARDSRPVSGHTLAFARHQKVVDFQILKKLYGRFAARRTEFPKFENAEDAPRPDKIAPIVSW